MSLHISPLQEGIDRVVDNSDSFMQRARVYFKNGHELSIVIGEYSYGGDKGLFEIMCDPRFYEDYNPDDEYQDPVRGYLTAEEVQYYIQKIASSSLPNKDE